MRLLAERFEAYLGGVRDARALAQKHGDEESISLLTDVITNFEKNTWFLRATLA